ncbi:MAG: hypothetical protein ABGZ35_24560, partial [Planctomycetaceae bacterium]
MRTPLFTKHTRDLTRRAVRFGRKHSVQLVWAVLDCPTTIAIAQQVAAELNVALASLVWDAPELLAELLGLDRFSSSQLLQSFGKALKASRQIGVVGETMKEKYDQKYGTNAIIVRHGLNDEPLRHQCRTAHDDIAPLIIGFAGTVTSPREFETLLQSLDLVEWQIHGRPVVLRLVGSRFVLSSHSKRHIEYFGWRSVTETISLLGEADMCYLPQPFSRAERHLARLSFPTKLSTYIATGRPVILHAPPHASVVPFFNRFRFGIWHDTEDRHGL